MRTITIRGHGSIKVPGHKFWRLTAVQLMPKRHRKTRLACICECGEPVIASFGDIRLGKVRSCGCHRRDNSHGREIKHGHALSSGRSPEYKVWCSMMGRCKNPRSHAWKDYGGRGIAVCDRWQHGTEFQTGFACFLADMGRRPTSKHELDRRDNNLGYEPDNCRWATRIEQARNTRACKVVLVHGQKMTVSEAIERFSSLPPSTVRNRLRLGWGIHDAIFAPNQRELGLVEII